MTYSLSLPDVRYGHLKPAEDAFLVGERSFVVADGITRDPIGISDFTGLSQEQLLAAYPTESGAALAADLFCRRFVRSIQNVERELTDPVHAAFTAGNEAIALLNKQRMPRVDYLVNDYCGCVAAGGSIGAGQLDWGIIGDCGIAVYNNKGRLKLRSPDGVADFEAYAPKIGFDWNTAEGRRLVRSKYRNNPNTLVEGVCVSYGALTGETVAERFMHFGTIGLDRGDLIIAFSDGFKHIIHNKDFLNALYHSDAGEVERRLLPYLGKLAAANPDLYGHERTLVAVVYE